MTARTFPSIADPLGGIPRTGPQPRRWQQSQLPPTRHKLRVRLRQGPQRQCLPGTEIWSFFVPGGWCLVRVVPVSYLVTPNAWANQWNMYKAWWGVGLWQASFVRARVRSRGLKCVDVHLLWRPGSTASQATAFISSADRATHPLCIPRATIHERTNIVNVCCGCSGLRLGDLGPIYRGRGH